MPARDSSPPATSPGARADESGKASASTARAPVAGAVLHATRAPLLRPPWTSGTAPAAARSASMISIQAASCRAGGPGARRPLTR